MLLECCQFGDVKGLQLLNFPRVLLSSVQAVQARDGTKVADFKAESILTGSIAVTYSSEAAAVSCAAALGGRWFDGRRLSAVAIPPQTTSGPPSARAGADACGTAIVNNAALSASDFPSMNPPVVTAAGATGASSVAIAIAPPPPPPPPRCPRPAVAPVRRTENSLDTPTPTATATTIGGAAPDSLPEADSATDVDDFLNSLL
jgi:hypothetical protein